MVSMGVDTVWLSVINMQVLNGVSPDEAVSTQ